MSQTSTTTMPTRGRPRKFDEENVLDALTSLFWEKGYEATSMADILEVTGLTKSSLYNAFGSKKELFRTILDRYIDTRMTGFAEMASAQEMRGSEALHSFLDAVFEFGRSGCLAVNTTTELGSSDPDIRSLATTYRDRIRDALRKVVVFSMTEQSPEPGIVDARTNLLLGFLLGYAVAARTGASSNEMSSFAQAAHSLVDTW